MICRQVNVVVAAYCVLGGYAFGDPIRVLMIGNSYTQGNASAPATFVDLQGFFDASPSIDGTVVNRSAGGATLRSHADPNGETVAKLTAEAGLYDVIVLQERSDRPGRAMKFGGGQLSGLTEGGPVLIEDYIKVLQPQARVVLFNTWARHPSLEPAGDDDLATWFNDNPLEMQVLTDLGYEYIRSGSPSGDLSDVTEIAPVGEAWRRWYETRGYADLSIALHDDDGSHQNALGSYLAAAVLFESITQQRVTGTDYRGGLAGNTLAMELQLLASATVGLVDLAGDYNADGVVDAADYTVWRDNLNGPAGTLLNDATGVAIGQPQYDAWTSNFGTTPPSASAAVPEPTATVLMLFGIATSRRRR